TGDHHGGESLLQRMELSEQRAIDSLPGLVSGPKAVSKGFDDVIGRDADVLCSILDHPEHHVEQAADRAERPLLDLLETEKPIEMTEQLIGPVDQMNDHALIIVVGAGPGH